MIFPILKSFFSGEGTTQDIADWVNEELERRGRKTKFSRQQVYPVIRDAIRQGFIRFCPPRVAEMGQRIADLNHIPGDRITVVQGTRPGDLEDLASAAAELILKLIKGLALKKKKSGSSEVNVHIGLGSGNTAMLVAKQLGRFLRSEDGLEGISNLFLHALSSGFILDKPLLCPLSCFSYFFDSIVHIKYVGLFTAPYVPYKDYKRTLKDPGVKEALRQSKEVEIVITSLGDPFNEDGLLVHIEKKFFGPQRKNVPLRAGDVQFRPFSEKGPLGDDPKGMRAVTLFEIEDLVKMVDDGKYVILVSGVQMKGTTKARSLIPLLTVPSLRVWSHLFIDVPTAEEIIRLQSPATSGGA